MPGSSPKGKIAILDIKKELPKVKKILDIGPGWGTYSKLLRKPNEEWDAVEVFEPYIRKFKLHKYYDNIYNVNIVDFKSTKKYDLVILGDVLEHLTLEQSLKTLKNIFSFSKYCLFSLPLDDETGVDLENSHDYWNNIHEKHLSAWSNSQFLNVISSLGGEVISLKKYKELGIYLVSCREEDNYINEYVSIFDKLKHRIISQDAGEAFVQKSKYYILKITPSFVIKKYQKSRKNI
jgi:predicted SAM-dependent methyltransferase